MKKAVCLLGLLVILTGCTAEADDQKEENIAEVITTEKIVPADFRKTGFQRDEAPNYTCLMKRATEQEQYKELWTYFRLQKEAPEVDMDLKNVLFFSLEESGSCPYELKQENIHVNSTTKTLSVEISPTNSEKDKCTLDAAPRTFIIEINEEVDPIENAVIHGLEVETTIPIE